MAEEIKNEATEEKKNEVAVAEAPTTALDYMNPKAMEKTYKMAALLAKSDLMPETYKNRPENVMIAMDIAARSGYGLMMILQNLYIVKNRPSFSGIFCITAIKGCGKYTDVKFVWQGDPESDDYGCRLQATEVATGEVILGTAVTWAMVKNEGWLDKNGSKWKTMPEQMFKYRAAAFFARTECPEVLMGLQTADEVRDVRGYEEDKKQKTVITLDDADFEVK